MGPPADGACMGGRQASKQASKQHLQVVGSGTGTGTDPRHLQPGGAGSGGGPAGDWRDWESEGEGQSVREGSSHVQSLHRERPLHDIIVPLWLARPACPLPSPAQRRRVPLRVSVVVGGGVGRLISRRVVECWSGRVAGLARPSVRRPPARTSRLPGTDARLSFSSRSRLDAEERKLGMLCASARLHGSVCAGAKWTWKCEPRFRLTVRYVPLPPGAPPTSQGAGRLRIGRRAPL